MKIRNPRRAISLPIALAALLLAGCRSAKQLKPAGESSNPGAVGLIDSTRVDNTLADDARSAAEAALGEKTEILASGDLARNELEQLLVVNRFAGASRSGAGPEKSGSFLITRAAILQKSSGQWSEVLLCDDHLKNPNGYLGGSPLTPASGWQLKFKVDTIQGLQLEFTPVNFQVGKKESGSGEPAGRTVFVQWNTKEKRYQSLDTSHERYLSEAPSLEIPHSILR